jgi:hypothetical protein
VPKKASESGHTTNVQPPLLGLLWSTVSNRTFSRPAASANTGSGEAT